MSKIDSEEHSQREEYEKMENYFNDYVEYLRKHRYIDKIHVQRGNIDMDMPEMNKNSGLYAYGKTVVIEKFSLEWFEDVEDITSKQQHLQKTLEKDMGFMTKYEGGSRNIRVKFENTKCKLKIIYAPSTPVFENQL